MNNKFIYILCFTLSTSFLYSCTSSDDSQKETETVDMNSEMQVETDMAALKQFANQYPMEVQFLDNALIEPRLRNLLGDDYDQFRKYWNVETPITVEDDVLYTTGCEQHNCGANQYVLIIDLNEDNINVIHVNNDKKTYYEKGEINLPNGIGKEFGTTISNSSF